MYFYKVSQQLYAFLIETESRRSTRPQNFTSKYETLREGGNRFCRKSKSRAGDSRERLRCWRNCDKGRMDPTCKSRIAARLNGRAITGKHSAVFRLKKKKMSTRPAGPARDDGRVRGARRDLCIDRAHMHHFRKRETTAILPFARAIAILPTDLAVWCALERPPRFSFAADSLRGSFVRTRPISRRTRRTVISVMTRRALWGVLCQGRSSETRRSKVFYYIYGEKCECYRRLAEPSSNVTEELCAEFWNRYT